MKWYNASTPYSSSSSHPIFAANFPPPKSPFFIPKEQSFALFVSRTKDLLRNITDASAANCVCRISVICISSLVAWNREVQEGGSRASLLALKRKEKMKEFKKEKRKKERMNEREGIKLREKVGTDLDRFGTFVHRIYPVLLLKPTYTTVP